MKAKEILKLFTGFSCPIFGVQWAPPKFESDVARDLIVFLEDKRVLYAPFDNEVSAYSRMAVEQIRTEVTSAIQNVQFPSDIAKFLRRLRKQCQVFCDVIGAPEFDNLPKPVRDSILRTQLEELRLEAGTVIGNLSVAYGIDVEDDLATSIPYKPFY